jgi:hypothetical protein
MKILIALTLIAAAMLVIALPFAASSTDSRPVPSVESERAFVVAQRPCPNGRC